MAQLPPRRYFARRIDADVVEGWGEVRLVLFGVFLASCREAVTDFNWGILSLCDLPFLLSMVLLSMDEPGGMCQIWLQLTTSFINPINKIFVQKFLQQQSGVVKGYQFNIGSSWAKSSLFLMYFLNSLYSIFPLPVCGEI